MRIKKFIAIISLLSMTGLNSYAYDIVAENEDGVPIYYNYINDYKELEVTYKETNYASYIGEVNIPSDVTYSGRTRKVTSIGNDAFKYCKELISITIPNSVTIIGELAFYECRNLEKVVVKDITAWCNIQFGHNPLFYAHHLYSDENTEITDLVIPNSVTSIGDGAFSQCYGITSVTIPNSVTCIGSSAFFGCTGLTSVTIPNSVTSIGNSAFSSSGLTSVTIGNSVTNIGDSAFENCRGLISVIIPNSVTNIGNAAFSWCMGLTSISIPNSVTSIGEMAFLRCTDLTSVTIGNSVTSIGASAFSNCTGLKKVIVKDIAAWCDIIFEENDSGQTLPNTNPLYYAHHLYCDENTEITDLVIPNGVRAIGLYAFYNCSGLTSVTIPNSVTSIGESSFAGCTGLTSVTIGNSVTSIGNSAFYECFGLTSVTIPSSVTSIGSSAFYGCTSLTSVTIPNSVTSIGDHTFTNCSALTSISIPNSVTSIGYFAFSGCTGLTSISIPNSVITIRHNAFNFTPNNYLEINSYIEQPTADTGDSFSTDIYMNAQLYIPIGTKEKYKSTEGWKEFVFIEEGMPSGISGVSTSATAAEKERYNLDGKRLSEPQRGINIIRKSDGTTKKVVIK